MWQVLSLRRREARSGWRAADLWPGSLRRDTRDLLSWLYSVVRHGRQCDRMSQDPTYEVSLHTRRHPLLWQVMVASFAFFYFL